MVQGEECPKNVELLFPDGEMRSLPLLEHAPKGMVGIEKDGGDDPDCTHGAHLYASLRHCGAAKAEEFAGEHDYIVRTEDAALVLRAVEGVGLCTRQGLHCDCGKWAVNSGPRTMLAANMAHYGMRGTWLLELGVVDGESMAVHTLNPLLGVTGGISILGTTGRVRPYSHEAYIETVRICVRSHTISGGTEMVLCTGGRTMRGAKEFLPHLPETAFVCIGDFIAESVKAAADMRRITVACMAGKLCKYAAGFENTHAHKVRQDMELMQRVVADLYPQNGALQGQIAQCVSVREALLYLRVEEQEKVLHTLADTALEQLYAFGGSRAEVRVLLFDFEGKFCFEKSLGNAVRA